MKSAVFTALLATSMLSAAYADSVPLDPYVGGRVVKQVIPGESGFFSSKPDTTIYTYQWPGVFFEAAFTGPEVDIKVDDDQNKLYVWIDGAHKMTLTKPGKTTVSLKDLGPGRHVVRLEKSTETQGTVGRFEGFAVPDAKNALPAPSYSRRIEFIGDSHTVGYGNISRGQTCTTEDVADTTDTSRAFAPAVAKHFGAAYRIHAFSGRGIVRNYNGLAPGDTLPYLYGFTLFDHSVAAPADGWTPDVIVVSLGTNDFSTQLNPGEKWQTRDALHADAKRTYADFVKSLHAKYPAAHIVMMASDIAGGEVAANMQAGADLAKAEGVTDLETLLFTGLDWQACHAHPSLKDDALIANLLVERIAKLPGFATP